MPGTGSLQVVLDVIGIAVAASAGAWVAVRNGLHLMGGVLLGVVTGLGGALVRDVLLGAVPPACLIDWRYLVTALAAGLFAQRFHALPARWDRAVDYLDAVWLGLFTVAGALKAVHLGVPPLTCVLMGVVTGIGGGVLRDVLVNRKPVVLTDEIYVFPSLLAALVVVLAPTVGATAATVTLPAAALCTAVRMVSIRRGWHGPSVRRAAPRL